MKWTRYTIKTTTEAEDVLISNLYDLGFEGAQIEDNAPLSAADKEQMFIDAPELEPDETENGIESGVAYLSFFVEIDDNNMLTVELPNDEGEIEKVKKTPEEMQAAIREKLDEAGVEWSEVESLDDAIPELDILYMTRIQQERFPSWEEYEKLKDSFILTRAMLKPAKEDLIIMHPLPRVNEIDVDVDDDPRACYFYQALMGKYIRMALILYLLGIK